MFEFSGIFIVVFVIWRITKRLIVGRVSKKLSKSVSIAVKQDEESKRDA